MNDKIEHRNVLAVHPLNKQPGLESVLKALVRFRQLAIKSCRNPDWSSKRGRGKVERKNIDPPALVTDDVC